MTSGPLAPRRNPDPATYAFAYAEAQRSLTQQQVVLSDLRGRAGTLLSVAAVATSFLGGIALDDGSISAFGWVAILFFAVLGLLTVALLFPIPGWEFRWNAKRLIDDYVEDPAEVAPMPEIHRDLALHTEDQFQTNRRRLGWMWWGYRIASLTLVGEVMLWLGELAIA